MKTYPNDPGMVGMYQTKIFELLMARPLPQVEEVRRAAELESLWCQLDYDDQDFAETMPGKPSSYLNPPSWCTTPRP